MSSGPYTLTVRCSSRTLPNQKSRILFEPSSWVCWNVSTWCLTILLKFWSRTCVCISGNQLILFWRVHIKNFRSCLLFNFSIHKSFFSTVAVFLFVLKTILFKAVNGRSVINMFCSHLHKIAKTNCSLKRKVHY